MKKGFPLMMAEVRRQKCFRCGKPAAQQWKIGADDSFRCLCNKCDSELNRAIMSWMRHPKTKRLSERYVRSLR